MRKKEKFWEFAISVPPNGVMFGIASFTLPAQNFLLRVESASVELVSLSIVSGSICDDKILVQ